MPRPQADKVLSPPRGAVGSKSMENEQIAPLQTEIPDEIKTYHPPASSSCAPPHPVFCTIDQETKYFSKVLLIFSKWELSFHPR